MENLEQIISKQNNIKEKITEYDNELKLYNKTYIEKLTELKSLKDELRDEKKSVQKDDEKIKILNFKIKNMNNEVSFMYTQVKDINSNISELKLELEQLKEELLENPEVKRAVYTEEKRRVQELKDAKILEKREIDTVLQNNPKDISEIPKNIAEKISKDSLYKQYDEQISNFTELLNASSNPRAKSSLEKKIKTLKKEKEEFLVSKLKEISSELQNSIHIYEKELQTLSVKEAKVILDRHSEINHTEKETSNVDISNEEVDEKENLEEKDSDKENLDNKENNNSNDSKDDKNDKDDMDDINDISNENDKEDITTTEILEHEYNPSHLPKKIGFFEKMKEKFKKAKEWIKEKFDKFKEKEWVKENFDKFKENDIVDDEIVNEDIKENTKEENENTKSKEQEFENKNEKELSEEKEEDKDINVDNDSKETTEKTSKDENEQNEEIAEESKEYTGNKYTQDEILDNEDIRKKIEDYMDNLEKRQQSISNKEKENSTKESQEKEEI